MSTQLVQHPLQTPRITPGQKVRFPDGPNARWWSDARAADDRYVVLTHATPFRPEDGPTYTILDTREHRRGPCNLTGQGWDCSTDQGCLDLLCALHAHPLTPEERGEKVMSRHPDGTPRSWTCELLDVEISHRNNVRATRWDVRPAASTPTTPAGQKSTRASHQH